jgi:uncharacterized protein YkwD
MKIKRFFKNSLLPTRRNNYRPYLTRASGLATAALLLIILVAKAVPSGQVLGAASSINPGDVVRITNQQRTQQNLPQLLENAQLQAAASRKAQDMLNRDYWNHFGPDGTSPWSFINAEGYQYEFAGENLAKDFTTSSGVVAGWMNSQLHRDNLLNTNYTQVGIATASGELQGRQTTLVVAMYGKPAATAGVVVPETLGAHTGDGFAAAALPTHYSLINPLSPLTSLSTRAKLALAFLLGLIGILISQHLVIRRHKLRWSSRVHAHPVFQLTLFGLIGIAAVAMSFGVVL